ncbi:MAG: STAS domain-containing protein [Cocleimonas sp.]|nr:STAS domain-containing protein [Cocleimonas sp.]
MSTLSSTTAIASAVSSDKGIDLKGSLVYSTVSSVLSEGCKLLEGHQENSINISLADVKRIDSAGIALLLEWKRLCDQNNKNYQVVGAQEQALSLITTNKMQNILHLS